MKRLIPSLLLLALVASRASASTGSCASAGDGTPCSSECVQSGLCQKGSCVPTALQPDGTHCTSGNLCSLGDSCKSGVCVAGPDQVQCPSTDACHAGICDPAVGCRTVPVACGPDLGGVTDGGATDGGVIASDGGVAAGDGGSVSDGGMVAPDLAGAAPADAAMPPGAATPDAGPSGVEVFSGGDGGSATVLDPGVSLRAPQHVVGSSIGSCAFAANGAPVPGSIVVGLMALALAVRLRRRRGR